MTRNKRLGALQISCIINSSYMQFQRKYLQQGNKIKRNWAGPGCTENAQ